MAAPGTKSSYATSLFVKRVTGVIATQTGPVAIDTNDASFFRPVHIIVDLNTVSGLGTPPTISIGTNAASYNNILGLTALTSLTLNSSTLQFSLSGAVASVAQNDVINVNISIGAIATTYTINVLVIGFYEIN
jgi:hypothetical protein